MAATPSPSKQRPQSMFHQLSSSSQQADSTTHEDDIDGDAELRRQQRSKINPASVLATGKSGFDWIWKKYGILGNWMNSQAGKMGMEAFWPTSLDRECDKCARILYTFTQRGLDPSSTVHSTLSDPHAARKTQRVVKKIPVEVIQQAEGLAIFTVFRSGLGWSAASGSGIVISRDSPTTWGPPSGILIHTIGVGFLAGIDVYDAVLVLRTSKAVMSFAKPKVSIGAELAVVAGPVGNGVSLESGIEASPVFAYTKSKGIYGGLQLDGNIIIERNDENARFYGRKIKAEQILRGGAVAMPRAASGLIAAIDAAEGKAVDPDEFPDEIDVAPSEQSAGVASVSQSRQKAALEAGTGGEEVATGQAATRTESELLLSKRRTMPPLPVRRSPALGAGSVGGSRLESAAEGEGEEASTKPGHTPSGSVEYKERTLESIGLDSTAEVDDEDPRAHTLSLPVEYEETTLESIRLDGTAEGNNDDDVVQPGHLPSPPVENDEPASPSTHSILAPVENALEGSQVESTTELNDKRVMPQLANTSSAPVETQETAEGRQLNNHAGLSDEQATSRPANPSTLPIEGEETSTQQAQPPTPPAKDLETSVQPPTPSAEEETTAQRVQPPRPSADEGTKTNGTSLPSPPPPPPRRRPVPPPQPPASNSSVGSQPTISSTDLPASLFSSATSELTPSPGLPDSVKPREPFQLHSVAPSRTDATIGLTGSASTLGDGVEEQQQPSLSS